MSPASQRAKFAAEHRHAVDRLLRAYASAPAEVKEEGRAWYANAQATAARLADPALGVGTERAAAIIAVLSPQCRWRKNIESAGRVIAGHRDGLDGYPANHAKAFAILAGGDVTGEPGDAMGGEAPKVRAFWRAICGDRNSVVLDVWAMRCATGKDGPPPSGARYKRAADWYRAAAYRVGEHPRDFQAIVWIATRGMIEHKRDESSASLPWRRGAELEDWGRDLGESVPDGA